jgi:hypothetical protein
MAGEIVFIHLGLEPVAYLPHYLTHARHFSRESRIILVVSARHELFGHRWMSDNIETIAVEDLSVSDVHRKFLDGMRFNQSFRGGFWRHSTERLFVLESAFRQLGLRSAFHAEYDNLLFFDAKEMARRLAPHYPGIATTFDSDRRAVAGVMYINDPDALSKLTAFFEHRVSSYDDAETLSDMYLLGEMRRTHLPDVIDGLPIMTPDYPHALRHRPGAAIPDRELFTRNFDAIQSVFDAAAIGQYLYGVDPRNSPGDTRGFINEEAVFDASVYRYMIASDEQGRLRPYIQSASGSSPLNNLHVHSKQILQLQPGPITVPDRSPRPSAAAKVVAFPGWAVRYVGRRVLRATGLKWRRRQAEIDDLRQQLTQVKQLIPSPQEPHESELAIFKSSFGMRSIAPEVTSALPLDIVVTVTHKDADQLPYAIQGIRRNLAHPIGRIFTIAPAQGDLRDIAQQLGCTFVDENSLLPLRRDDIEYRVGGVDRSGWLFQQILKLASDAVVGASCYLIVDSDTVLVRRQVFEVGGLPVLLHSDEHHPPYFRTCERILGWPSASEPSCVAHAMLVDVSRLAALKSHIERRFDCRWFEAILRNVDFAVASGFSEFELYGQWCIRRYPLDTVREYWFGRNFGPSHLRPIEELERRYGPSRRLVAFHSYWT